jgi:hypothetical protein
MIYDDLLIKHRDFPELREIPRGYMAMAPVDQESSQIFRSKPLLIHHLVSLDTKHALSGVAGYGSNTFQKPKGFDRGLKKTLSADGMYLPIHIKPSNIRRKTHTTGSFLFPTYFEELIHQLSRISFFSKTTLI